METKKSGKEAKQIKGTTIKRPIRTAVPLSRRLECKRALSGNHFGARLKTPLMLSTTIADDTKKEL
jgi:hypothetical protein